VLYLLLLPLLQVLCGRCNSLAHGAMIPGVKDFTQKAWLEQQADLLSKQQQQQQQQKDGAQQVTVPAAAGAADAAVTSSSSSSSSSSDSSREPLELLGKVLVTAEELRDKIAVRAC
jgi:transcription initiation factor TFIID subunit TAF12